MNPPSLPSARRARAALVSALVLGLGVLAATGASAQPDPSTSSTSSSTATTEAPTTSTTSRPSTTSTTVPRTTTTTAPRTTTTTAPSTTTTTEPTTSSTFATTSSAPTTTQTTQPQIIVPTTAVPAAGGGGGGLSTDAKLALVVGGLVAVGAAIGVLTVLYWRHTRPVRPHAVEPVAGDVGTATEELRAVSPLAVGAGARVAAGGVVDGPPGREPPTEAAVVGPVAPPPTAPRVHAAPPRPVDATEAPPLEIVTLEDLGDATAEHPMRPDDDPRR